MSLNKKPQSSTPAATAAQESNGMRPNTSPVSDVLGVPSSDKPKKEQDRLTSGTLDVPRPVIGPTEGAVKEPCRARHAAPSESSETTPSADQSTVTGVSGVSSADKPEKEHGRATSGAPDASRPAVEPTEGSIGEPCSARRPATPESSEATPPADQAPVDAVTDYPKPQVLSDPEEFVWDEDDPLVDNFQDLGIRLAKCGDLYRVPSYASGLVFAPEHGNVPVMSINTPHKLAAVISDMIRIRVTKGGKNRDTSFHQSI